MVLNLFKAAMNKGPEVLDSESEWGLSSFVNGQERFQGRRRKIRVVSGELNNKIPSLESLVMGLRELGGSRFSGRRSRNYSRSRRSRVRIRGFFEDSSTEDLSSLLEV